MCEHLTALENELKSKGLKETYRGQPWSGNCREWVYYDCVLDVEKLKSRYNFSPCVTISLSVQEGNWDFIANNVTMP
jgi:hypothetical protein